MKQDIPPELEERNDEERRGLPRWKKLCVAAAIASILFGLGLSAFGDSGQPAPRNGAAAPSAGAAGAAGLVPGAVGNGSGSGPNAAPDGAGSGPGSWSPFFVKGGFSFFVGFSIGYALRAFFKISAVAFGLLFLILAALSYYGVIQVDWSRLGGWFDTAVAHLRGQFSGVRTFLLGSLPSAGLGGLGLVTGFKRS